MTGAPRVPGSASDTPAARQRRAPPVLDLLYCEGGCCPGGGRLFVETHPDMRGVRFCDTPAHADVLVVAGRISLRMIPELRSLYERMPEPRWVVAMGACAASGGAFDTYCTVQGLDRILPVDAYVPGCPPTPEALAAALSSLRRPAGR